MSKKYYSKLIRTVSFLTICCFVVAFSNPVFARENSMRTASQFGSYASSGVFTVEELYNQSRFTYSSGHGFAAEEANNLIDSITQKAEVVGYDNAKNGADRLIIGRDGVPILIQDKYYSTASNTIGACFDENGMFKYLDGNGCPMQIEVPKDQYESCLELMKNRIRDGKVPGITDPEQASSLVRQGNITYKQAVNLTKAGTIESLTYDAVKGCVSAATAFGISTTLDFALRLYNGENWKDALKESSVFGLKTGAKVFAIAVISSQLAKTKVVTLFKPAAEALVKTFGDDFTNVLLKAYGVNMLTNTAKTNAAVTLLQSQALVQTVTIIVLSVPDVIDLINGRISAQQLLMNLATATAGVVGSTIGGIAGSAAGSAIAPGAGSTVGGIAGGIVGGVIGTYGANAVLHIFYKSDAEKMMDIIQDEFYKYSSDYLVSEKEANSIAEQLKVQLEGDTIKEMFASEERDVFARDLLEPLFEKTLAERAKIKMPSNEEMRYVLKEELQDIVFIH